MAPKDGVITRFAEKLKLNKKLEIVVYGVIILAAILIYTSGLGSSSAKNTSSAATQKTSENTLRSEDEIEKKLEETLSNIDGAGKVQVMITYETGAQIVPAMSEDTEVSTSQNSSSGNTTSSENKSSEPVTIKEGSDDVPLVITEKQPTVRGVLIVAQGAGNIKVKLNIQRAVQAVLGISISQIEVFEMSSKK